MYLLTVGRDVTGIGDWWFYHWTANDLADGHFYVEPFRLRFEHKTLPSAGHPPLYPLAAGRDLVARRDRGDVAPRRRAGRSGR